MPPPPERRPGRIRRLLVLAAVLATAFIALYLGTVHTAPGQILDVWIFGSVQNGDLATETVASLLRTGLPWVLGLSCVVLSIPALRAGRWRAVLEAFLIVVVNLPLSGLLRRSLDRPYLGDHGYVVNTLPSGHVTAVAALAIAAAVLSPPRIRRAVVAGGAVVTLASCVASVVGHAHRPSDVVASVLLAGTVTCVVLAALDRTPRPATTDTKRNS